MAEILAAVPAFTGAGVGGLLMVLVLYLLKLIRDDTVRHRETVTALRADHRDESRNLEAKIDRLEARIDELQKVIDTERELRRDAQDHASRAETRAATAEAHFAALRRITGGDGDPATAWLPPPPPPALAAGTHPLEATATVDDPGDEPAGTNQHRKR